MITDFSDVQDLSESGPEWVLANPAKTLQALNDVKPDPELLAGLEALGVSWGQFQREWHLPWYDQWPYDPKTDGHEWAATTWLIHNMLPIGGVTLLAGPGSAGKTHIAVQLAVNVALASKKPWLGTGGQACQLNDHGRVVWVTWETRAGDYQKRLVAACAGNDLAELRGKLAFIDCRDQGPLFASPERGAPPDITASGLDLLERTTEYGAKVLVIDPVAGAFGADENNRPQVRRFLSLLGSWATKHDGVVLILSHPAKQLGSTYSGSTDWEGGVQSRLHLSRLDCVPCKGPDAAQRTGLAEYQIQQLRELRILKANETGSENQRVGFTWSNDAGTLLECSPCPHDEDERKGKSRGRRSGRAAQGQAPENALDDEIEFQDAV